MMIYTNLRQALKGWMLLAKNDANGMSHFRLTNSGLVTALILFYLAVSVAVLLASMQVGVPTAAAFVEIVFIQSLWLVALVFGVMGTHFAIKSQARPLDLLVPAVYALIIYLLVGTVISLITTAVMPLLWLALAFLLFRLGRIAGKFSFGIASAFAALTVVLLVGLPVTLYMLA